MKVEDNKICEFLDDGKIKIEDIIKQYTNYVSAIISKLCINISQEDIEEIKLDVFFILWKNQNKLNVNNNMSSYIRGVTKNLIKQRYKYIKNNENILDYEEYLTSNFNMELEVINREQELIVLEELNKLKEEDKHIFFAYYYENKTIKEISTYFKISNSKVKTKLYRIRKKLQKILKVRGYDFNE